MKEKSANDMLLELGYKKEIDAPTNLIYQDKENNKEIRFWKIAKCVEVSLIETEDYQKDSIFFTMQELKAINKFCEERGWNKC